MISLKILLADGWFSPHRKYRNDEQDDSFKKLLERVEKAKTPEETKRIEMDAAFRTNDITRSQLDELHKKIVAKFPNGTIFE